MAAGLVEITAALDARGVTLFGTRRVIYRDPRPPAEHFKLGGTTQPLARLRELLKEVASAAITLG